MTYAGAHEAMTDARGGGAGRPPAVVRNAVLAAVRAVSAPRSWQATFHLIAGMFLGAAVGAVFAAVAALWWSAVYSLIDGPTGSALLPVVYALAALAAPVAVVESAHFASVLQRERFRAVLGVEIPAPARGAGTGWRRLVRPWRTGSTWRQLAYHVLAAVLAPLGAIAVVLCWAAPILAVLWANDMVMTGLDGVVWFGGAASLLLAAPWLARGLVRADTAAARRLLGPGRAAELAHRVESLARSRQQLVAAADSERRRIERDLHDGVQQRLVSLAMNLGMARAAYGGDDDVPQAVRDVLAAAHDEATVALAELRDFVRGLHPAVLDDRGLDAALSGIAARIPLPVRLRVDVAQRCSPSIEAIAYFTVSEALTNVVKHARAGRADVTVSRAGGRLSIVVTDDGRGGASADGPGTGLRGLAQRAEAVDGALTVVSPPGGPTTVTVDLPCE
jgi:signal transduction histidine kinase